MVKVAVFASGSGSNFQNLVEKIKKDSGYEIKLLVVDKENAYALERAKKMGIENIYINPKEYKDKAEYEKEIIKKLKQRGIDYIVLAGYMRIISKILLDEFENKIINIHPAYLPNFPGKDGIGDAYRAGAKETGVTIHFVDSGIDTGKIIYQEKIKIDESWSLDELKEQIHKLEHKIYPETLTKLFRGEQ